jgi:hypothetical protein
MRAIRNLVHFRITVAQNSVLRKELSKKIFGGPVASHRLKAHGIDVE